MRLRGLLVSCMALVLLVGIPAAAATGGGNSDFAMLCQHNGWMAVSRADGTPFTNQGDCVSYGAQGGLLGQTISFTSTNPSPVTVGGPAYTPTATATSGLQVTFTLDLASTGCTYAGGTVSFTAAGTCLIDANQAGNTVWAAAPQVQQSITVNPAATLVLDDNRVSTGWGSISGSGLKPGATVYVCENGYPCYATGLSVDVNGSLSFGGPVFACTGEYFPVYVETTAADGTQIDSNPISHSPCAT